MRIGKEIFYRLSEYFLEASVQNYPNFPRIAVNAGWLLGDSVVRMGFGFFITTWMIRYLGPEQFGILSYAIAFVALFSPLAKMGLDTIIVRNIVQNPARKDEILGSAFILKLLGGGLVLILTLVATCWIKPQDHSVRWLIGIVATGTIFQAFEVIDFYFQSQVQSKYAVLSKNCAFMAVSMIKVFLILTSAPLIAFAITGVIEIALGGIGLVISYQIAKQSFKKWLASFNEIKRLLKDSWLVALDGFAIMIQACIDQIMLAKFKGNYELGQYAAALQIVVSVSFIFILISSSFAPFMTEAKAKDKKLYEHRLFLLYRLMFLSFLCVAIPISLFALPITDLLFGKQYSYAGFLLSFMTIRLFFTATGTARNLFIVNEGLFAYSLLTTSIGAVFNIGCNSILIPLWGSVGAIVSMAISFFITIFLIDFFYLKTKTSVKLMISAITFSKNK